MNKRKIISFFVITSILINLVFILLVNWYYHNKIFRENIKSIINSLTITLHNDLMEGNYRKFVEAARQVEIEGVGNFKNIIIYNKIQNEPITSSENDSRWLCKSFIQDVVVTNQNNTIIFCKNLNSAIAIQFAINKPDYLILLKDNKLLALLVFSSIITLIFSLLMISFANLYIRRILAFLNNTIKGKTDTARANDLSFLVKPIEEIKGTVKQLSKQLEEKTKLESLYNMAREVAHDIKEPLSGIVTGSRNLISYEFDPEERKELLESIEFSADRVSRYVRSMLDYTKQEQLELQEITKDEIFEFISELSKEISLKHTNLHFTVQNFINKDIYKMDFPKIERVLNNIIYNSVKAIGDDHGEIIIELNDSYEKQIVLSISDNGPGITQDIISKFTDQQFYTTDQRSYGLGLAICRKLINLHGGSLRIDNKQDKGTKIIIEL